MCHHVSAAGVLMMPNKKYPTIQYESSHVLQFKKKLKEHTSTEYKVYFVLVSTLAVV